MEFRVVYMCEVHVERSKYEHCGMYTVFSC